jgi:hypothetical protein
MFKMLELDGSSNSGNWASSALDRTFFVFKEDEGMRVESFVIG